jgi:hypothetical protein
MTGEWHGIVFVEGLFTTDSRIALLGGGTWQLPLPLSSRSSDRMPGKIVGSIATIERRSDAQGFDRLYATGDVDWDLIGPGPWFLGASVEPLATEVHWKDPKHDQVRSNPDIIDALLSADAYEAMTSYRLLTAMVLDDAAFPECVFGPIDQPLPDDGITAEERAKRLPRKETAQ